MKSIKIFALLVLGTVAACGDDTSTEPSHQQPGNLTETNNGGAGSAGGGGSTPDLVCPPGVPKAYGVPLDRVRECADTEESGLVVACGHPSEVQPGYFCTRRLSDGKEFIGFSPFSKPVLGASGWESCPWDGKSPLSCNGLTCERGSPMSTCSLAGTTALLGCGKADVEWDKDCCLRRECAGDEECAPDQVCKEVTGLLSTECWATGPNDTCECGGLAAAKAPQKRCVEEGNP
jgi:hypothetical protein